jgi:hypothetical protein
MTVDPNERPYSINELTVLHHLSRRTVIRLYENEPGGFEFVALQTWVMLGLHSRSYCAVLSTPSPDRTINHGATITYGT